MTLMLNGAAFQSFRPKRGLRQGDPISPYLFILCMEVLSRLINQKVSAGLIAGFKLDRHTPALHHLFFADDIFLMGKCTVNEAFYFKDCLDTFCSWSGQSFNPRKSNIFFSSKASGQSSGLISALMGFDKISTSSAYLGLPLFRSGRSKDFNFLVENLDSKLAGWKSRVLSKAKRLSMKLPNSICSKLDAIIRNFWWSASKSNSLLCLKAWAEICQPKQWGGLGFRRMKDLNLSLLAKWAWKLVQGQSSLCCSILNAQIIRSGTCYLVGNGESIDIWEDPWVPSFPGFRPPPKGEPRVGWMSVKDLNLQPGMWDRSKLHELFDPHIVNLISAMHLPVRDKRDTMIWTPVSNGTFSAKSTYLSTNATRFKENSLHLFVFCDLARMVWFASPWNLRMDSLELASPMHFIRFLWDVESKDSRMAVGFTDRNILLFASVLCDLLWKHRNDITHGGSPMDPSVLCRNISRSYQSLLKNISPPTPAAPISWSPPPIGWVKINMDAAIGASDAVVACVARDSKGDIISWGSKIISVCSPLVAEACAAEFAIDFASSSRWSAVNFAGDAKVVLDALSSLKSNVFWSISAILDNCILKLNSFVFWSFSFAPREANILAHNLARWALFCCCNAQISTAPPPTVFSDVVERSFL
ncbi:hypothetical protein UlMin_036123 [Ulmus minor]